MKSRLIVTLLSFVLVAPLSLWAQVPGEASGSKSKNKKSTQAKKQRPQAKKNIAEFEMLLVDLDALDMPHDNNSYRKLNGKLRSIMQHEYARGRSLAIQAKRESQRVQQDYGEVRTQDTGVTHGGLDTATKPRPGDKPNIMTQPDVPQGNRDGDTQPPDHRQRDGEQPPHHHYDTMDPSVRVKRMGVLVNEARRLHVSAYKGNPDSVDRNREVLGEFLLLMEQDRQNPWPTATKNRDRTKQTYDKKQHDENAGYESGRTGQSESVGTEKSKKKGKGKNKEKAEDD